MLQCESSDELDFGDSEECVRGILINNLAKCNGERSQLSKAYRSDAPSPRGGRGKSAIDCVRRCLVNSITVR